MEKLEVLCTNKMYSRAIYVLLQNIETNISHVWHRTLTVYFVQINRIQREKMVDVKGNVQPNENRLKVVLGLFLFMYVIQHCFVCRPSDSTVSEDAGIESSIVATLALTARRRSNHSAISLSHFGYRSHPLLD
jgi:hypothetical protein